MLNCGQTEENRLIKCSSCARCRRLFCETYKDVKKKEMLH